MKINIKSIFSLAILLIGFNGMAQDQPQESGLGDAAKNAVNPGAFVTKLQMQPNFTWKDNDARQFLFVSRIIKPSASIGLPFIKSKDVKKIYTIYRLEMPIVGQTFPAAPMMDATGLADLTALSLVTFKKSWGMFGVGPGLIIPTMKPKPISGGKWCAGPTVFAVNTSKKGLVYGLSLQQFASFAGASDRADRNFMVINPIFNKILSGGYFIGSGPLMMWDFKSGDFSVPITATLGKVFAKNLSMLVGPQYMVTGPNKGDFTFQFQLNAMFPASKK